LIVSSIAVFLLINYAQAGCYLDKSFEDCKYRHLLDFGPNAGDSNLTKQDDHFILIKKPVQFKFYGKYFESLYVSTNGVVQLIEKNQTFDLHEKFSYNPAIFQMVNETLIAPFWTDMISDSIGDVFYRLVTDEDSLRQIEFEIDRLTKASCCEEFKASWVAVITWYKQKAFNHKRYEYNNTFQLVLTTNGEESYVLFNYGRLEWPNSRVKANVESGLNLGDGKNYYKMEGSFTPTVIDLENKSNVGMRSKWLFRVDEFQNSFLKGSRPDCHYYKKINKFNIAIACLLLITSLYALIMTGSWIYDYFSKQKLRPRLQMKYAKHLNSESIMNLNETA